MDISKQILDKNTYVYVFVVTDDFADFCFDEQKFISGCLFHSFLYQIRALMAFPWTAVTLLK